MSAYYLQDSGLNNWQIGVSILGQPETTSAGAETILPLVLLDSTGVYWQLGVTTLGQLTTTSVGATGLTLIVLVDSNGVSWLLGVTPAGQLMTTQFTFVPDEDFVLYQPCQLQDQTVTVWR